MFATLKGYWQETRKPVYSIALILPFLCVYHTGTVLLNTTYINGADALIIRILGALSVRSMFGSVLVLAVYIAIWQWRSRANWDMHRNTVLLAYMESLGLAMVLFLLFSLWMPRPGLSTVAGRGGISDLVLFCGAGIYEELVFRAFLLGILGLVFRHLMRLGKNPAACLSVAMGALLFAAFHYIGPSGDAFTLFGFFQRFCGGLYFSILFVTRGFGVTAACHAFYDILVGLLFL